ncbi:MAG TPA: hypothetical protein VIW80_16200 [Pyrinomonadaceae bacterium]
MRSILIISFSMPLKVDFPLLWKRATSVPRRISIFSMIFDGDWGIYPSGLRKNPQPFKPSAAIAAEHAGHFFATKLASTVFL